MNVAIPPILALIPVALALAVIVLFSLINIIHLLRYGLYVFGGAFLTVVYVIGVLVIFGLTLHFLPAVSWMEPMNLGLNLANAVSI